MINYTPLHCHSTYSVLDGLSQPKAMAERCFEIGATACALTDHGNIAGAVKFYTEMKKKNIEHEEETSKKQVKTNNVINSNIKKGGMDYIYKYQKTMYGGFVENEELNKLREEIEEIRRN
jgi:DNA polymerase III alpha subunit